MSETQEKKVDRRSITSKLNAQKARQTKLNKLAEAKAEKEEENNRTYNYEYYSDSESDDYSDSDSEDAPTIFIKNHKKSKVASKKQLSHDPRTDEINELRQMISDLQAKPKKQPKQPKEPRKKVIQVVQPPQPTPAPVPEEKPKRTAYDEIQEALKNQILRY